MANDSLTDLTDAQKAMFGELEKNWGWLMAFGILSILLGTVGIGMSYMLTQFTLVFFGLLLIVGGVFQLLETLKCRGWKSVAWNLLIALLYIGAGVVMVMDPRQVGVSLTLIIAWILIAVGILRAIMAFQVKPAAGWYWPLISGLVSVLLGGMIMAEWPQSGLWIIGLFIAIELIFHGWAYLFIARAARAAAKQRRAAGGGHTA